MDSIEIYHPKREERNSLSDNIIFGITTGLVKPTSEGITDLYEKKWAGELAYPGQVSKEQHDMFLLEWLWMMVEQGGPNCPIPRLTAASIWDMSTPEERKEWLNKAQIAAGMNLLWKDFTKEERQDLINYCPKPGIRSFMVGDVVKLNHKFYLCADVGWEPV